MPSRDNDLDETLFRALLPVKGTAWRDNVTADLRGRTPEDLVTTLAEGIDVEPLYTRDHAASIAGFPGLPPYTRGARPLPEQPWIVCQEHRSTDPGEARREIEADLARGVNGLWLRFAPAIRSGGRADTPDTHAAAAHDESDADLAGILIRDRNDVDALLAPVPLESTYLAIDAGAGAPVLAALLAAHAASRDADVSEIGGCLGFDPLGALVRDGRLPSSLADSFDVMTDLAAWCTADAPRLRAVAVDTCAYHDAGATAVDELAYAVATGTSYLRRLTGGRAERPASSAAAAGLSLEAAAQTMSFTFSIGRDLFVEVAKLRAARLIWAKIFHASGAGDPSPPMHVHARTSYRTKTRRDPWVNALRATTETMVAAFGGADVITTSPYDEPLGPPEARARRLASNTQHILASESHLWRVLDPLGGSWYVEHLTDSIARRAWERFQAIEALGGMDIAVTRGEIQKQTNVAAERRARAIAERRDPIVGVSVYTNAREKMSEQATTSVPPSALTIPSDDARSADSRELAQLRANRDRTPGALVLGAIRAAEKGVPLPHLLDALLSGSDPAAAPRLRRRRDAAQFERIRDLADARDRDGRRPKVFLANLGARDVHGARAVFARRFFEAGGFAVVDNDGFDDVDELARAYSASGASFATICSSDDLYVERAEAAARALTASGARTVLLAGRPEKIEQRLRDAGVGIFIHVGTNALDVLESLFPREEGPS